VKAEPVLLVAGSDEYQRRRLISKISSTRASEGWAVTEIEGGDKDALETVFSMSVMFASQNLVVVTSPEKLPLPTLTQHIASEDPSITFLLVSEEDKPSGPVFDLVPKAKTKIFTLPAFYKMDEYAANFAVSEARTRGNPLDFDLALSLVKRVGIDLGMISFEVQKASLLAGSAATITAAHLRETMAPIAETDGNAIADALGSRDRRRFVLEMTKYKNSRGGDSTIELCGRVLTPALTRWLQAAHLSELKMSPESAARSVGANPWYWENKILPCALQWKVSGCAKLIRVVAESQTLVFQGSISPFSYLESALLNLLAG